MPYPSNKTALITRASRGIGAAIATGLAKRGSDVIVNYRSKKPRAEKVAAEVGMLGQKALLAGADITPKEEMLKMMDRVRDTFGKIDLLILNASGGLEKNKPADYAMTLNRDAQVQAVDLALPLIPRGSRIVFVTSHWAHFYGEQPVYPDYEAVASSKKAGELALRKRIPELSAIGIDLIIVSGDLIEGTITPKLLERSAPGLIETRREQAGALPNVEEFAEAIVNAASNPELQSGATVYVGRVDRGLARLEP